MATGHPNRVIRRDGQWVVLNDDGQDWVVCDNHQDAQTVALAHLLVNAYRKGRSDVELADWMDKTASILRKYQTGTSKLLRDLVDSSNTIRRSLDD
jgi:hypothetical protein